MMQMRSIPAKSGTTDASLIPLPAFSDNYIWLLRHHKEVVVVDPGQALPVLNFLQDNTLQLHAILLTHHHSDHVDGVMELVHTTGATVYGPAQEHLPHCDIPLSEGDQVSLPKLDLALKVLEVPGHTAGHIAYVGRAASHAALLFCGDTLFSGGCGRLFEGTPAQMKASLDKLAALAIETQVCCAHEYTLANLRWALAVEPNNPRLQQWYQWAQQQRAQDLPTLPSSIGRERDINPFLRCDHLDVANAAARWARQKHASPSPLDVFATLRDWKNHFQ